MSADTELLLASQYVHGLIWHTGKSSLKIGYGASQIPALKVSQKECVILPPQGCIRFLYTVYRASMKTK